MTEIYGHIVDVINRRIYDGIIKVEGGLITRTGTARIPEDAPYILPGFIDSHIHIESTLLTPEHYAALAIGKGVVSIVTDPHEIANVLGVRGIAFMIDNGKKVRFHFNFGAPSCVPCTSFETSGAVIDHEEIARLLKRDEVCCVAEFMNAFGLIGGAPECIAKVEAAGRTGKPVDGHAPGLDRDSLLKYAAAGVSTDHECVSLKEALDHLDAGIMVQIREGSASRDFEALSSLLADHSDRIMFCSDDKYPDDMQEGYIDRMVSLAVKKGYPLWNVLDAACVTPVRHYGLKSGLLQEGDNADFIMVDNLSDFNVKATYIDGKCVFRDGNIIREEFIKDSSLLRDLPNNFKAGRISKEDLRVSPEPGRKMKVIVASDLSIRTGTMYTEPLTKDGNVVSDTASDVLKTVVCNRYAHSRPRIAFIHGFGLKRGAIASSIAHDSHNIVAIGADDESIVKAVNRLVRLKGGLVVYDDGHFCELPLPVAGLMSELDGGKVARRFRKLKKCAEDIGCVFKSTFMTLSFMCLPVIPDLKLTDKGLFDANKFRFTGLFSE